MLSGLAILPIRTGEELPPRPPTATPYHGTRILLSLERGSLYSPEWWTTVQWQDEMGEWNDVTGWQGTFDENRQVVWWVGSEHFGTGPFRWVVYESVGKDAELATSKPFKLPLSIYTQLEVKVSIPQQ